MVTIHAGLDLGDRRNVYLLRKFRLFTQIQEELPSFWLRYSDKYIEDIALFMFGLLQFVPATMSDASCGSELMTPLHFVALLDPLGKWFRYWMHGVFGRSQILKSLRAHSAFLDNPIAVCTRFPTVLLNLDVTKFTGIQQQQQQQQQASGGAASAAANTDDNIYTSSDITYAYFLHSVSMLSHLLLYDEGAQLISRDLPDGTSVDPDTLVVSFINIVKLYPHEVLNTTKSLYHPVYLIVEMFTSFVTNGVSSCQRLLCQQNVCAELLEPIKKAVCVGDVEMDLAKIYVVADILFEMAGRFPGFD